MRRIWGNWHERALDHAISLVSPKTAFRRSHFRRMERDDEYRKDCLLLLRARGYKAAASGRNSGQWFGGSGNGDSELTNDLPIMRNRSRELDRDDPLAGGIYTARVNAIVTRELRARARTADPDKNARIDAVWTERKNLLFPAEGTKGITLGRAQRRVCRRKDADGDVFVNPVKRTPEEPIWFELIEGDRVSTPPDKAAANVFDGIEKDAEGQAKTVYVAKASPGKSFAKAAVQSGFVPVPARWILHTAHGDRGGLTRGEPLLHAVMQDLRDLDLLLLAILKKSQVAACLAAFIQASTEDDDIAELTAEKYGYKLDQQLEPGMIYRLYPNETVNFVTPNIGPDLMPVVKILACRVGAAIGCAWEYVLWMFSEDTYSSSRVAQLASEPSWDIEREQQLADIWTPVRALVLLDAKLRGDQRLSDISEDEMRLVAWQGDSRKWVDPAKQALEKETKRQLGIETWQQQCAEAGVEARDNLEQIGDIIQTVYANDKIPDDIKQPLAMRLVFGSDAPDTKAAAMANSEEKGNAQGKDGQAA